MVTISKHPSLKKAEERMRGSYGTAKLVKSIDGDRPMMVYQLETKSLYLYLWRPEGSSQWWLGMSNDPDERVFDKKRGPKPVKDKKVRLVVFFKRSTLDRMEGLYGKKGFKKAIVDHFENSEVSNEKTDKV